MGSSNEPRRARLAVVGLGKMGIMHTTMVRACPRAELVGICDRDTKSVAHVRSMGDGIAVFGDVAEMIAAAKPDGIILSTPQFTHRALGEQCLAAGVHLLTEKPLAHTLDDARALAAAALKSGSSQPPLRVGVGLMKGHDDFYLLGAALAGGGTWARSIADGGALDPVPHFVARGADPASLASPLGRAVSFRASVSLGQVFKPPKGWTFTKESAGGGVLINTGIHLLHLLRLFFGRLVRVACLASPVHATTEDTLSALVEHEAADGTRTHGTVSVSWCVPECATEASEIIVQGTNGWLWFEDNAARLHLLHKPERADGWASPPVAGWNVYTRDTFAPRAAFNLSPEYGGEGYANEIADFAAAVLDSRPCRFGARHGLEMQAAVDAWYRSAEAGGAFVEPAEI